MFPFLLYILIESFYLSMENILILARQGVAHFASSAKKLENQGRKG